MFNDKTNNFIVSTFILILQSIFLNSVGIHSTTNWQWWGITLCTIVFALVKNKR
jgi:hypothetical protein